MITEKESIIIKEFFGTGFKEKITQKLKKKNIRNRKGAFFKSHSISDVLNGQRHSVLEEAIREVWQDEISRREKQQSSLIKRSKALMV